jgi:integrase
MVATKLQHGRADVLSGNVGGGQESQNAVCFSHRGRDYTLFNRPGQEHFSVRTTIKNDKGVRERRTKGLGTADQKTAIKNARLWLDAVDRMDWGKVEELRGKSQFCTVGQILDAYELRAEAVLRISHKTRLVNGGALLLLVAEGLEISQSAARERRADILAGDLVRRFVAVARMGGMSDPGIASRLRKARAVVSRVAVELLYEGLKLPDMEGFRRHPVSLEGARDLGFRPFPEGMRLALEARMVKLRDVLPGVYLSYLAMARLGLRNCEVWPARWDWFRQSAGGQVVLEIRDRPEEGFTTKTGEARDLLVPAGLWEELRAVAGSDAGAYFLPGGTPTERRRIVERDLNRMLRPILTGYRAGAYELRRWAGSLVWSTQGPAAAQRFLGHTSMSTTERYYARFLKPVSAVSAPDLVEIYGEQERVA